MYVVSLLTMLSWDWITTIGISLTYLRV